MDFGSDDWSSLVGSYMGTLRALHLASGLAVGSTSAALTQVGAESGLGQAASAHLANSQAIGEYLAARARDQDPDAQILLGRTGLADLGTAQYLEAASEEPPESARAVLSLDELSDFEALEADLRGYRAVTGGAGGGGVGVPQALDSVKNACGTVLSRSGDCGKHLATGFARSLGLGELEHGLVLLLGGSASQAVRHAQEEVGWLKKMALDHLMAGVDKIAQVLSPDGTGITAGLKQLWDDALGNLANWAADLLGRSDAIDAWSAWLATSPPPGTAVVVASLAKVNSSQKRATDQLQWTDRAVGGFGVFAPVLGKLHALGLAVMSIVAAALGGWIVWLTVHFLRGTKAAAEAPPPPVPG